MPRAVIRSDPAPESNDEAGQYIATFKQFEHKPPDLIKERVDKDYDSQLRTALTSINKVNKTDVETLRTSLGVCPMPSTFINVLHSTSRALRISVGRPPTDCKLCPGSARLKSEG
jgi:hypothetical protein